MQICRIISIVEAALLNRFVDWSKQMQQTVSEACESFAKAKKRPTKYELRAADGWGLRLNNGCG